MAVTRQTLRHIARLRADLDAVLDAQTRALVSAWADAWSEVSGDLDAAMLELTAAARDGRVTRSMALRSRRLAKALGVVADALDTLASDAGVLITGDLDAVVAAAGAAQEQIIATQLPAAARADLAGWDQVDDGQIAAIVRRATQQITSLTKPLSPEAYQAVRRELIRGVAAGSNPRETARRMVRRAEGGFNGGLTRALVISRSETLDAHRDAARLSHEANADVLTGWTWACKLDGRSCPACWAMHGTVHDVTDPGPLDHQQGRCARLPKTQSWADLGFDDIDEPDDLLPDAAAAFEALTEAEQRAILGPKRYEAWKRGDFPMSAWARRKSTEGWRDSYVVASPPSSGGRRSRSAA